MLYYAVLCCTMLYYAVLCCTMLYYAVLCCTMLYLCFPCLVNSTSNPVYCFHNVRRCQKWWPGLCDCNFDERSLPYIFSGCHCCFPAAQRKGWLPPMRDSRQSGKDGALLHIRETNIFFSNNRIGEIKKPTANVGCFPLATKKTPIGGTYFLCVISPFAALKQPLSGAHHHPRHSRHSGWPATYVEPWRAMPFREPMGSDEWWATDQASPRLELTQQGILTPFSYLCGLPFCWREITAPKFIAIWRIVTSFCTNPTGTAAFQKYVLHHVFIMFKRGVELESLWCLIILFM